MENPKYHKGSGKKNGEVYSHGLASDYVTEYINYPRNLLEVPCERGLHPTQKPVALFEYLIRTYTDEDAFVLDNCIGSGTTAVACIRSGRNYIGFELDAKHYETAASGSRMSLRPVRYFLTPPGVRVVQRRGNFPAASAKNRVTR